MSNLISLRRLEEAQEIEERLRTAIKKCQVIQEDGAAPPTIDERLADRLKSSQKCEREWAERRNEIQRRVMQRKTLVELQTEASRKRSAKTAALLKLRQAGVDGGLEDFVMQNLDLDDQFTLETHINNRIG
eukprot:GDKJ01031441.1.p1 GENE.GDKJ01031441.1~~GDKJ01031441.1.p1  ORF type:complete len:131 (-),score=37.16 GDKJ01031441.1:83-475(-)